MELFFELADLWGSL